MTWTTRWPRFAPHAAEVGFQSVSALPMRLRTDVIGALNLFSTTPEPLSLRGPSRLPRHSLTSATIGILQERAIND